MKNKNMAVLAAVLVTVIVSISCKTLFASELVFEPDALPAPRVGEPYEAEIHVTENRTPVGEFFISKGSLPAGLELVKVESEDSATIGGIPEESGTFTFTVNVWCYGTNVSGQTGEKEYSLVVEP